MSSYKGQECGEDSQLSIAPPESIAIPRVDSVSQNQDCMGDRIDSKPDPRPSESTAVSLAGDAFVSYNRIGTTSPVIPRTLIASLPSNPQSPRLLAHASGKSEDGSGDLQIHRQEILCEDATVPESHVGGTNQTVGRKLSGTGNKHLSASDKDQEAHTANVSQQIGQSQSPPGTTATVTAGAVVMTGIRTASTSHERSTVIDACESSTKVSVDLHQQTKSKQRIENLPRLALLDLPLLGITPPSHDVDAAPQTLERIQDSPPLDVCPLRSPADLDQETHQIFHLSTDLPRQEPCPVAETLPNTVIASETSASQADDGLDDEVTFIVSVPRRRKRKKRSELPVNRPAQDVPGISKSSTTTALESASSIAASSARSSSVPQTPESGCAVSASPITRYVSTGRSGSLPLATCITPSTTAQISRPAEGSLESNEGPKVASEKSEPIAARKSKAIVEPVQIPSAKRKGGTTDDQEDDVTAPIKRPKIQNEPIQARFAVTQGRSAVAPANHERTGMGRPSVGCAATTTSPPIATLNTGLRLPNPGISSSQLHGTEASSNGHNRLVEPASSPRSAQNNGPYNGPYSPTICHVPNDSALRDLRRKPSLYSIPSWPSSPVQSISSGTQQRQPSATNTETSGSMASQVTQTSKSALSAPGGQIPVSRYVQRSTSSTSPQIPSSSQSRTASSYVHSLENHNRPVQPLPARNVYAVSPWPPQQILTVGQQMQQDYRHPQPQQFALTPQEYARRLHSQYTQASQFQQQARYTAISPQMRQAESSPSSQKPPEIPDQSQTLPSPNLLVDIAQTCQAVFPFARIAERHNQPIKKVFDAFSAVIQIPLLQCAADRRRNGKFGAARMKNFREASKAVSETHEKERKVEKEGAKMRNELAEPPAKKPKGRPPKSAAGGKGLLGVAISNSQRNASGSK